MKTSLVLDHEPVADGGYLVHALLRVEGHLPEDARRPALDLALVLDASGSMGRRKFAAAREAAASFIERLDAQDQVGVVSYDDGVRVVAPMAGAPAHEGLAELIRSLEAGGNTNLSDGWLEGVELLRRHRREAGVHRVLVLTDGHANVGITDPEELAGLAAEVAAEGVSTSAIGFGTAYDQDLLGALADAGTGELWHVEKAEHLGAVLDAELASMARLVARNLKLYVHPDRHVDAAKVVHGYPHETRGDVLRVDVGSLRAGTPLKILLRFLVSPDVAGEAHVATLTLEAQLRRDGEVEAHTVDLPITFHPRAGGKVAPEVRRELLLVDGARARMELLDAEDAEARAPVRSSLEELVERGRAMGDDHPEIAEELTDLEAATELARGEDISEEDRRYLRACARALRQGRTDKLERFRR